MARKRGSGKKGGGSGGGIIALIKSVTAQMIRRAAGDSPTASSKSAGEGKSLRGGPTLKIPAAVPPAEPANRPPMVPSAAIRAFIPTQRNQPYSPLTRGLGGQILRMGPSVPPHIAQAASDAVNGTGSYKNEAELLNMLRGSLGIEKTGATKLNKTLNNFNRGVHDISDAAVLMDVASRGGASGTAAKMGLAQMAMSKGAEMLQSRTMRDLLTSTLGGYAGRRAFVALGQGIRIAGPLLAGAVAGSEAGLHVYDNMTGLPGGFSAGGDARLAQARGSAFDVYKKTQMDPRLIKSIGEEALATEAAKGYFYTSNLEEASNKRRDKVIDSIVGMRAEAQSLGIDVGGVVAKWAAEHGVDPNKVTPENRAMLVDVEIKKRRDTLMRRTPESAAFIKNKIANMTRFDRLDYSASTAAEQRSRDTDILDARADDIFHAAAARREIASAEYEAFVSKWQAESTSKDMGGRIGVVTFSEMEIKMREIDIEKKAWLRRHKAEWDF